MRASCRALSIILLLSCGAAAPLAGRMPTEAAALEIVGVSVTPHVRAPGMRYRREPDPSLGARVELFLRNNYPGTSIAIPDTLPLRFDGKTPAQLLESGEWSWYDMPDAWPGERNTLERGALVVWKFNSRDARWGVGKQCEASWSDIPQSLRLEAPKAWISTVTFLSRDAAVRPDTMIVHVANDTGAPVRLESCRLWLPRSNDDFRVLLPGKQFTQFEAFPSNRLIPAGDRGIMRIATDTLPLTYAAIEIVVAPPTGSGWSLWSHLRIKRESFDISGGWVNGRSGPVMHLSQEPFLKLLRRLHIDTAHIGLTPGYTDQIGPDGLYTRYPLKLFNKLQPLSTFDTDQWLPRIHAAEFLGEPQYGGGKPVAPMECWKQLAPYQRTRLATSLTHSEEAAWRYYAGLSDFPHYDAYRVTAPAADAWRQYDRWGGARIGWGAPLETIGEMCRSLRELNRPMPTAYWSQGPHQGWSVYDGRKRTSPTPDEIRMQAYHALSSRITSLYWFNLSLRSLVLFRDTLEEIERIGREIRMLDWLYLEGDAYRYERITRGGKPDWDLASIVSPRAAGLFALDLAYGPDLEERIFRFGPPRESRFSFILPAHLRNARRLFRIDADGVYDVAHKFTGTGVEIRDKVTKTAIYIVTSDATLRERLQGRRRELVEFERSFGFDPARNDADFSLLNAIVRIGGQ